MAENPLAKLPLAQQIIVALVVAGVIGGGFYFGYWQKAAAEQAEKTETLENLRKEIQALEVTASKLDEFKKEVEALEQRLETLKRILPPAKETPDLMRKVQYLASQSNLDIKSFRPGATAKKEFYEEWPIAVQVEGTYHNLGLFFDRVSRLSRLVNIADVRIQAGGKQTASKTIQVNCTAKTYVYVDQPPAPKAAAKGKRK